MMSYYSLLDGVGYEGWKVKFWCCSGLNGLWGCTWLYFTTSKILSLCTNLKFKFLVFVFLFVASPIDFKIYLRSLSGDKFKLRGLLVLPTPPQPTKKRISVFCRNWQALLEKTLWRWRRKFSKWRKFRASGTLSGLQPFLTDTMKPCHSRAFAKYKNVWTRLALVIKNGRYLQR